MLRCPSWFSQPAYKLMVPRAWKATLLLILISMHGDTTNWYTKYRVSSWPSIKYMTVSIESWVKIDRGRFRETCIFTCHGYSLVGTCAFSCTRKCIHQVENTCVVYPWVSSCTQFKTFILIPLVNYNNTNSNVIFYGSPSQIIMFIIVYLVNSYIGEERDARWRRKHNCDIATKNSNCW